MPFIIRPAEPQDAEAVAALRRVVYPYLVTSAEQLRREITRPTPAQRRAFWVASSAGVVSGWAGCGLNSWTSSAGVGALAIFVHPDHRGNGIGSALLAHAETHLAHIGAQRVQVFATADAAGFASARGFTRTREMHYSSLDPRELPAGPPVPAGVRLVPIAALDPRQVYEAESDASLDEPSEAPLDAIDFEEWLADIWEAPMLDHDLSTAAVVDGKVACFTAVETDGDRAWSAMTGTVRAHRRRGLAKLVKATALARAADAGIVTASTSNDARNAAMLAVNDWLGYRRVATHTGLAR